MYDKLAWLYHKLLEIADFIIELARLTREVVAETVREFRKSIEDID